MGKGNRVSGLRPSWRCPLEERLTQPASPADLLGIPQVVKPPHLAARGGCWFESSRVKLHLDGYDRVYVDDPFGNRIELMEPRS